MALAISMHLDGLPGTDTLPQLAPILYFTPLQAPTGLHPNEPLHSFHKFVNQYRSEPESTSSKTEVGMGAKIDSAAFRCFPRLPFELQLEVIRACADDGATLWALMRSTRAARNEACKLFWSSRNIWFQHDGKLACCCKAKMICDPLARRFPQQVAMQFDASHYNHPGHSGIYSLESGIRWWAQFCDAFPSTKKVWLVGNRLEYRGVVLAWQSTTSGSEGVDLFSTEQFLATSHIGGQPPPNVMIEDLAKRLDRDGSSTEIEESSSWFAVALPTHPVLRDFRAGSYITQLRMLERSAARAQVAVQHSQAMNRALTDKEIARAFKYANTVIEIDKSINAERKNTLSQTWGEEGRAKRKLREDHFWEALGNDVLLCAADPTNCRGAGRILLENFEVSAHPGDTL